MRNFIDIVEGKLFEGVKINSVVELAAFAVTMAETYESVPVENPGDRPAWDALTDSNVNVLLKRLKGSGMEVEYTEDDPYSTIRRMLTDMTQNKRLRIYSGHSDNHPVFNEYENIIFRTVHDFYTHGKLMGVFAKNVEELKKRMQTDHLTDDQKAKLFAKISLNNRGNKGHRFVLRGELNACSTHMKLAPRAAQPALFTEVAGQACYNTVAGDFPPQKASALPGFDYQNIGVTLPGSPQDARKAEVMKLLQDVNVQMIDLKLSKKPTISVAELMKNVGRR